MQQDYTIFLQVLDQKPAVITQNDSEPQGGEYPTGLWDEGEVVVDRRTLTLPSPLLPGRYRIVTGLYLLATGERLPVRSPSGPLPEGWVVIGELSVP
jgi:hypothetical protein